MEPKTDPLIWFFIIIPIGLLILFVFWARHSRAQYARRIAQSTPMIIPSVHGVVGDSSITLINATFYTTDGSVKECPDPDFSDWIIATIYNEIKVFAIMEGLRNPKYLCPACSQELNPDGRHPIPVDYLVQYKQFPPFTIQISVPSVECPSCHKICGIDPDTKTETNLTEAVARAFLSANIKF